MNLIIKITLTGLFKRPLIDRELLSQQTDVHAISITLLHSQEFLNLRIVLKPTARSQRTVTVTDD